MKKFLTLGFMLILLVVSCKEDDPIIIEEGTLRVVNQTSCSYNITGGANQSSEYVGTVAPNETKEFKVSTELEGWLHSYRATPNNCAESQILYYSINISTGETKQILIN